jgi:hypothetical protein
MIRVNEYRLIHGREFSQGVVKLLQLCEAERRFLQIDYHRHDVFVRSRGLKTLEQRLHRNRLLSTEERWKIRRGFGDLALDFEMRDLLGFFAAEGRLAQFLELIKLPKGRMNTNANGQCHNRDA